MAVSTRHLHRKNLRGDGGGGGEDDFRDAGVGGAATRRRLSGAATRRRHSRPQRSDAPPARSNDFSLDEPSTRLLSRFLFDKNGATDGAGDSGDVDGMPSMGEWDACMLALAMEPAEVRNERIVMLFEAYALFGALYANAVWILYEWGSYKGYGYGGGDATNPTVARVFECVMAILLCLTMLMAFFAAWWWITAINFGASNHEGNFVVLSLKALKYLIYCLALIITLVVTGIFLGIYLNLSPNWPETIVALAVIGIVYAVGMKVNVEHSAECAPLEVYHHPLWFKVTIFWFYFIRRTNREKLRARAKVRAEELRRRRARGQTCNDTNSIHTSNSERNSSPMGILLRMAAANLGRIDHGRSSYQARLEEDWLSEPEQLRGMDVDVLSRYMPYALAREVHRLIEQSVLPEGCVR